MFEFLIGNDLLSSLAAFVIVLIPAVIVHEIGHFLAAKAVGITILEFGIGYPPKLFRMFRWRETEFTFNLIPLGGFVRPLGEDMIRTLNEEQTEKAREALQMRLAGDTAVGPQAEVEIDERQALQRRGFTQLKTVNEARPGARILFMAAGAIANIFAALILFIVVGLIGVQQVVGAGFLLMDIRPDSVLNEVGIAVGDVIEFVDGQRVADTEEFLSALSAAGEGSVVLGVLRTSAETGEAQKLEFTVDAGTLAGDIGKTTFGLLVDDVQVDSPAATAGIQRGDTIVGLDGQSLEETTTPFDLLLSINMANAGKPISIEVIRAGTRISLPITPRASPEPGQGYLGAGVETLTTSAALGTSFIPLGMRDTQSLALGDAVSYGLNQLQTVFDAILGLPARLLSGSAAPGENRVISIVGISQIGGTFLQSSIQTGNPNQILNFIALVNIALGLTNLLPLPPLDGGRILFILIEMLRGRPLSQRREETIMIAGMIFLLALGVVVIVQDLRDPITNLIAR